MAHTSLAKRRSRGTQPGKARAASQGTAANNGAVKRPSKAVAAKAKLAAGKKVAAGSKAASVRKALQQELLGFYDKMVEIRRFEEEAARAYAQGKIGGFLHLYIGQEAVGVGTVAAMRESDYMFQSYRDHGVALARGMSPDAAMAELFGKDTGCSRGLGGSMHFFDVEHNFLGGYGIVGGHIPLAAGTAFKSKYLGDGGVTVCLFGDGATNINGFHEALSLAGLWKLPVVFICENNEYSMGTPLHRTSPVKDIAEKAPGYGMDGVICEGFDVVEVRDCMRDAIEHARSGKGPVFVEMKTYRFRGHSISDPAKYRSAEELNARKQNDPIELVKQRLADAGVKASQLAAVDEAVEARIQACIAFADAAEPAKTETMHNAVFAPSPAEDL